MLDTTRAVSTLHAPQSLRISADPAVSPLLQAHVLFTQLDAEMIEGDGQYPRPNAPDALVPIGFHRSVTWTSCESISRRGCDGLRFRIASIVRALGLSFTFEFDACERDMSTFLLPLFPFPPFLHLSFLLVLPTLLFLPSGRPLLFPGSRERRIRHAPRPLALPPARAGLLHQHDTERDAPSDYEATTRLLDAARAYDHTARGTSPRTPYHVHALKGEQHLTPAHLRYDTQQALPFLHTRAAHVNLRAWDVRHHRRAQRPMCPILPPTTTICGAAPFSRSPNYHLHHHPRAQRSQWLFFIAGAVPFFCPRSTTIDASPLCLPGLPSMQEHPHTPGALPAHTRTQTHSATGMRPRLKQQEAIVAYPRRDAANRTSAPPPRWSVACASRLAPAVAGDRLQHHHTERDIPRDYESAARCARCTARLRRRLMRAIASATLYHADTLDATPARSPAPTHTASRTGSAFVVSPRCATVSTSVPPSPLDPRACRGLQDHPQHLPHLQRLPRPFLIAGAAFVAFSYATTIYCPHRSTRAAGHIPNTTLTSPAPTAASHVAFVDSPRTLAILSAVPPPLKTCPWHAP
ncbi:hypothetical protein B0H13DRAFT_2666203 [Mycena leptocephala]|nr:hypothetical protein B0H13DRAFT_2666203 [Mycena leptocephala]